MLVTRSLVAGLVVVLSVWTSGSSAWAQEEETIDDPVVADLDTRVNHFLQGVSKGQTGEAFDELLAGSALRQQEEALKRLIEKTDALKDRYGAFRAAERIDAKHVGTDVVLIKYLYKCEDYPLAWYFTFYRTPPPAEGANDVWRAVAVRLDTDLEPLDR